MRKQQQQGIISRYPKELTVKEANDYDSWLLAKSYFKPGPSLQLF